MKLALASLLAVAGAAAAQEPPPPAPAAFVFEEIAELAPAVIMGETPTGRRQAIPITGGTFSGRQVSPGQDVSFETITGEYRFTFEEGWPDIQLSNIEATQVAEGPDAPVVWKGTGASGRDGTLTLTLASGSRSLQVDSTLDPNPANPGIATLRAVPAARR